MEGASSLITYLPEEEPDGKETVKLVESYGQSCYAIALDLRNAENCKRVVEKAVECLGGIDILVNNAGTQNMIEDIKDLTEYVECKGLACHLLTIIQGSMGRNLCDKYRLGFLPLEVHSATPETRIHHHQLRLYKRLYWKAGPT